MLFIQELLIKRFMKKEWLKCWPNHHSFRQTPKDKLTYQVHWRIVDFTVKILQEYGLPPVQAEGVVYWAGTIYSNVFNITTAFAPAVVTYRYGFMTNHFSNGLFAEFICDNDLIYIAQVHSHPGKWVDHSGIDDRETAFRSEGLLSIVVPNYGRTGMLPLRCCGVHRYQNSNFVRLSDAYINKHFTSITIPVEKIILKDARHG
jgi:hypothetical protein